MMKKSSLFIFIAICVSIFLSSSFSFAQKTKKELENKKKQLQKEIEYTNQLLDETKKNKKLSLNQLVTLNKKISVREELIATINNEVATLNRQINENNNYIKGLQNDLSRLKAEYAKMVYNAYKNQDAYSRLMFIFAAKDFEQAFSRLKYFQQYSEYRHKQAEMILATNKNLKQKVLDLEVRKTDKRILLGSQEKEKESLTAEKGEKEQVFTKLQEQEQNLKKDLDKKKKDAEKLQLAIQRAIEKELEKAQKEAETDNKPKPLKLVLTPEAQELSNSFEKNKGKLPWPVAKGIVSERFGVHPHPLMPGIDVNNNGVDITTSNGTLARAIFDGEVTAVGSIPSSGQFIIIRHGEFLTIYSNLKDVYVKVKDKVKTKQNIASIIVDEDDSKTLLNLQVWKGKTKLDPEEWLYENN